MNIIDNIAKVLDIGYITILSFFSALLVSKILDNVIGKFDIKQELKKSLFKSTITLLAIMWVNGLVIYGFNSLIKHKSFPSPVDYISGYNHATLRESTNTIIFTFIVLKHQTVLLDRLRYLYEQY
jgi:hypothetical protein